MPKRNDTLDIEKALMQMCEDKIIYGCEEITIGFSNNGYGKEIVDFMTMDSKGILRCYEIKVTLSDLKSKAKKSWYGHYNYLVVTQELYYKINDWSEYLPDNIGLLMAYKSNIYPLLQFQCMIRPKKQNITDEMNNMLKESMVRSIYYKMIKYMDSQSIEAMKNLQKDVRHWKNLYNEERKDYKILDRKIRKFERLKSENDGKIFNIDDYIDKYKK